MAFCILRLAKLKTDGNVGASISHSLRTRETRNADQGRMGDNLFMLRNAEGMYGVKAKTLEERQKLQRQVMKDYRKMLPEKIRKNAVRGLELMITMSPEALQDPKFDSTKYLRDSLEWVVKEYGYDNIFLGSFHEDEKTPHLSVFLVPKIDGKLNARELVGNREKLSALQTKFADEVGKKHGLERGVERSKATHQDIKKFYAELDSENATKELLLLQKRHQNLQKRFDKLTEISLNFKNMSEIFQERAEISEKKLKNWRSASPEKLEGIAAAIRSGNAKNYADLEKKQERAKNRQNETDIER